MFFKKATLVFILIAAGVAFFSCGYDKLETKPCEFSVPDSVSFSNNVLPLFRTYCSTPGCHSGGSPEGHLNLEDANAYSELSNQGSGYINLVKPEFSILYSQMNSVSQPMPPDGKLDECRIELILKWIQQGAKNN